YTEEGAMLSHSSRSLFQQISSLVDDLESFEEHVIQKRDTPLENAQRSLQIAAARVINAFRFIQAPLTPEIYEQLPENDEGIAFLTKFNEATSDSGELGTLLSEDEKSSLLALTPSVIPMINMTAALDRYNRTLTNWNKGILTPNETTDGNTDFEDYNVQ